jgi:methylglyoxal synthase
MQNRQEHFDIFPGVRIAGDGAGGQKTLDQCSPKINLLFFSQKLAIIKNSGVFMKTIKNIGLIAHDACKKDMMEWVAFNARRLSAHKLYCTGTTGRLVKKIFAGQYPELSVKVTCLKSGPLGGDQQMGALVAANKLDILIFFTDPMTMQPHDVDIKALLRLSSLGNLVLATTRATADFVISSHLFEEDYCPLSRNFENYTAREIKFKDDVSYPQSH